MSKGIRTLNGLQDALDKEISWRLKEIADMKLAVRQIESIKKKTVVRAGTPLLYAHWEGFIKNAAKFYLEYVDYQGHNYEELANCFVIIGLKKKLVGIAQSKQANANNEALEFIRREMGSKSCLTLDSAIRTESNLSSSVFENICYSVGISHSWYETKYNLIDESLLKRRNMIAHGEYLDLNEEQYRDLADEVIGLLRNFKTDVENAASLKSYKRVA